jgi:hypothetical protein
MKAFEHAHVEGLKRLLTEDVLRDGPVCWSFTKG